MVYVLTADGTIHRADKVMLAAGAFSPRIAQSLGEAIPLETECGYNTTLSLGALDLRLQITFGGHEFVVSSLSIGIRVGGEVEVGGFDLPLNYKRADAILTNAQQFLPGLKTTGGSQWIGFRPSLPDSLPVIGSASATNCVIYAFGHGHLGLTQSTCTARLGADLLTGQTAAIELAPFSPQRFRLWQVTHFPCIDGHTCGNPVRLVKGGPRMHGTTMLKRRAHFLAELDWIRTGLMFEPRGHDMMSGTTLYPLTCAKCERGVSIETSGSLLMCGHGTIGTITFAIENRLIKPRIPGQLSIGTHAGEVDITYAKRAAMLNKFC